MPSLINRVAFKGGYDLGPIKRAEVREMAGGHALSILDFPMAVNRRSRIPESTPMTHTWGMSPLGVNTFYGYVNHHEVMASNDMNILRLFCIGTSLPLNDPHPKAWQNVTASFIAREIAARHNLRAVVRKSDELLPHWAQGNESDVAMLNRLAERTGYRWWVDGSTLYFLDPSHLVQITQSNKIFQFRDDGLRGDTLLSHHVVAGSMAPRTNKAMVQEVYGLDRFGGRIKSSSSKAYRDRGLSVPTRSVIQQKSARSADEARRLAEAASNLGNWSTLTANVRPNSRVRVGSVVNLAGRRLHTTDAGLWWTSATTNVIERGTEESSVFRLFTTLELTRNQIDTQVFDSTSKIKGAVPVVPASLNGNVWESQVLGEVYV